MDKFQIRNHGVIAIVAVFYVMASANYIVWGQEAQGYSYDAIYNSTNCTNSTNPPSPNCTNSTTTTPRTTTRSTTTTLRPNSTTPTNRTSGTSRTTTTTTTRKPSSSLQLTSNCYTVFVTVAGVIFKLYS